MRLKIFALFCLAFIRCPEAELQDEQQPRTSSISYCSEGQRWLPGRSAPSGNCDEPRRSYPPEGDMA